MRSSFGLAAALVGALLGGASGARASETRGTPPATHLAGFAKRVITPDPAGRPVFLAGFANGRRATGVHDPLWARAFAVCDLDRRRTLVLVAVDLIGVFNEDVRQARAALAAKEAGAQLVVASTHDHAGPDTLGMWGRSRFSSGVDRAYLARVREAIADAALEALASLQPVRFVIARTRTPGLIADSRQPIVIDDSLLALQALDGRGATLGTLISWSSHPEALGGRNTLLTSDYPHYLRARIEERLGGTCVFVVGAIGGLMTPLGLQLRDANGGVIRADSFELAQAVGERAADAALAALRARGRPSGSTALEYRNAELYVPLENRLLRLAILFGVVERRLFQRGQPASALFGEDLRSEIGYLRLGELEALLVPGEIYPELVIGGIQEPQEAAADFPGAPRERPLFGLLRAEYKLVVGLANDEIGYVIPRSEWDEKAPWAYGRRAAPYGEINSVGPSAAARLEEGFERLIGR